jgi:hypothetical protein
MNLTTLVREAGPEAPPLTAAARSAARAALLDEIEQSAAGRSRVRRPRRRTVVRVVAGLTAVAAAWTTAVVVAGPDDPGTPATSVDLVSFEPPTFPFTLDPMPAGFRASFSADPGDVLHAGYGNGPDRVGLTVTPHEPDLVDPSDEQDVTVLGRDAELVTQNVPTTTDAGETVLRWTTLVLEWSDHRWVQLHGEGRYADRDRLLAAARTLVARPQPVPLQVHLAPAGWSVLAYKDDRVLTLVNDSYEQQDLTVHLPAESVPADRLRAQLTGPIGPVLEVTVHGRPAQLVRVDLATQDHQEGWYLQAHFPDGATFVVQAPGAFTRDQLLRFAEQVTHTG